MTDEQVPGQPRPSYKEGKVRESRIEEMQAKSGAGRNVFFALVQKAAHLGREGVTERRQDERNAPR